MADSSKKLKLNNGLLIPIIGLGTTGMKSEEVVYQSIKDGTRLIDTASFYKNEVEVGNGIKKALNEGIIKREDLFVVTKVWADEKEDPEKALKNSLKRLQLDYVDLYLDHWPCSKSYTEKNDIKLVSVNDMWPKMEKLVEQGLTKSIGVSNYNVQNLLNILSFCKIKPVINEVEFHPYLYQKELKEFCDKEDIKILGFYPFIKGKKTNNKFEKLMNEKNLDLLNEQLFKDLSKKYGKTVGQVILNWHIHLGVIPIPGTHNPNRMKENLDSSNFTMEEEDYQKIGNSFKDKQCRFADSYFLYGIDVFA